MNPWARPLPVPGVLSMDRASENYAWWPAFPKTFLSLEVLLPLSDFPRPGKKTSNPEHWHFLGPPHIRIWRHALPQTLELVLIVYFDKNILMSDYHSTHATKQIDNRYLCEPNKTWVGPRLQSWFCLLSITKYMVVSVLPKLGFFFVYNPSSTTLNLKHEQPHCTLMLTLWTKRSHSTMEKPRRKSTKKATILSWKKALAAWNWFAKFFLVLDFFVLKQFNLRHVYTNDCQDNKRGPL